MTEPKSTIYAKLLEISTLDPLIKVYQGRPEKIATLPCITFNIESNVPNYALNKQVSHQSITVKIDIWAETSKQSGSILKMVIEKMLELNYRCTFNQDIEDPTGISHITTQFIY